MFKNKKIQQITSCIVFVVLLIAAIVKCADVLEYKESRTKYIPFFESDTNFDVVFMGTSHMHNHVMPMEIWKDYGIASYNWGYSNCTLAEDYYLIPEIVKYTTPKLFVIDLYGLVEYEDQGNGKYRTGYADHQHVQFDSLPIWSVNKYKASKDVFDDYESNEDFIWDFIKYHNRWSDLGKDDFEYVISPEKGAKLESGLGTGSFVVQNAGENLAQDKGGIVAQYTDENITKDIEGNIKIDSVCYEYLIDIIEYCHENDIHILFTYMPYGSVGEKQQTIANAMSDILSQYPNCDYVNMLTEDILDMNTDIHIDNSHLNYSGALKVSEWLGQYLSDNYELDDYSDNSSWVDDYEEYRMYKADKIRALTLMSGYLVQMSDDDFECEIEVYDQGLMESDRFISLCENAEAVPVYCEMDTDKVARIIVKNASTGDIVDDAYFAYDVNAEGDFFSITQVDE